MSHVRIRPFAPHLSFLPYSLPALAEGVRRDYFPQLAGPIPVFLVTWEPLACVVTSTAGGGYPAVYVHPLLNHPATPVEVMRFVFKHELLHFVCGARVIGGERESHPPEFWAEEARIGPERDAVWDWIWANFHQSIRHERQGVAVVRGWTRQELGPRLPWAPGDLQFYVQVTRRRLPRHGHRRVERAPGAERMAS